jgi:type 1 glutamine amidotransferase
MKRALIIAGGWDGHHPEKIAELFSGELQKSGYRVQIEKNLDALDSPTLSDDFDLIFPGWTMGQLTGTQSKGLSNAIRSGVGLGGIHGGMGDAFRGNLDYEWMVGGHFVGHPHVGDYLVEKTAISHEITDFLPGSFSYKSEQYYMMIDPGITVLADTAYTYEGRTCRMPVIWTKYWGQGRVFYSALGHQPQEFIDYPEVLAMTVRGLLWATR